MREVVLIEGWPAAMPRTTAAAYVSERPDRLPPPSYGTGRAARWLRSDLDAWVTGRKTAAGEAPAGDPWAAASTA